jgi:hypothetical protein
MNFGGMKITMIMAQHLVLATQSIKIPPPTLEHITVTNRMPTMSSDTSFSPHTAKSDHKYTANLTVVHEHNETPSQTTFERYAHSPIPHFVIDIEQYAPSRPRLPVGYAL